MDTFCCTVLILLFFFDHFIPLVHNNLNLFCEFENLLFLCLHYSLQTIFVPLQSYKLDLKFIRFSEI
jgi:hypothetical protein